MSHTARPIRSVCRAVVAGAGAVVLLAACGGGSDDTASATASAAEPAATGDAEFCTQAATIDDRVDSALEDLDGQDPSVPDAFRQIAEELRGITPPDAIATAWETLSGGLDRMAEAFSNIDITDADSLTALDDAEGTLSSASSDVEDYLRDECGITP
jgi:Mrp family chromosome partitioning ATPase